MRRLLWAAVGLCLAPVLAVGLTWAGEVAKTKGEGEACGSFGTSVPRRKRNGGALPARSTTTSDRC